MPTDLGGQSPFSCSPIGDIGTQVSLPCCVPAVKCYDYSEMSNLLMPDRHLNSSENQREMTFPRWIRHLVVSVHRRTVHLPCNSGPK